MLVEARLTCDWPVTHFRGVWSAHSGSCDRRSLAVAAQHEVQSVTYVPDWSPDVPATLGVFRLACISTNLALSCRAPDVAPHFDILLEA